MEKNKIVFAISVLVVLVLISLGRFSTDNNEASQNTPANEQAPFGVISSSVISPNNSSSDILDDEFQKYIDERMAPMKLELEKYQTMIKNQCKEIQYSSPCLQAIILKDEVSGSSTLKMSAQATQQEAYEQEVATLSDDVLIEKLKDGVGQVTAPNYGFDDGIDSINLRLKIGVYLVEAEWRRKIKDPIVQTANDSMLDKFGPCWGIPYGWCLE